MAQGIGHANRARAGRRPAPQPANITVAVLTDSMKDHQRSGLSERPFVVFGETFARRVAVSLAVVALAACAPKSAVMPGPVAGAPVEVAADEDDDDGFPESQAPIVANLPPQDLTPELLYEFLVAEIGAQRGYGSAAVREYVELARRTRDPRVARRATDLARRAGDPALAAQAARIWADTDPTSIEAAGQYAAFLAIGGRADEALPYLQRLLSQPGANVEQRIAQVGQLLAQTPDRQATLRVMQKLAADYPKEARARLEVARAAYNAGNDDLALAEAREALKLRPDWELAALTEAQILQRRSNAEATVALAGFLERHPKSAEARLQYARFLVLDRKYPEARAQFQKLLTDFPDNTDVVFAVAVLSIQLEDWTLAETNLKRLLNLPFRDRNTVYMYLGQVAEEQKHNAEALGWYEKVTQGDQFLPAQIRRANVVAKQGDVASGRKMIADARARLEETNSATNQARVQLILAEAQLLRDANQTNEAFDFVGKALDRLPNHPDLLYDYAMLAERLDRVDVLEASLRTVMQVKPDNAHAYNALGYTLADRNQRLPEAKQLIEKALAIDPDNAMIVDSMGWVLYRMGDLEGALKYLQRAYQLSRRDPEIAAHLGEVLWTLGRRDEAEAVWSEALAKTPSNETVLKTVQRLKP